MVTTVQLADGCGARCRYKPLIVVALGVVLLLDSQMPSGFLVTWSSRCRPDYQKSRGRLSVTELVAVQIAVEPVVGTCRLVSWRARSRVYCHRSRRCHVCCSSAAVLKLVEPVAVLIMAGPPGACPAALHTSFLTMLLSICFSSRTSIRVLYASDPVIVSPIRSSHWLCCGLAGFSPM